MSDALTPISSFRNEYRNFRSGEYITVSEFFRSFEACIHIFHSYSQEFITFVTGDREKAEACGERESFQNYTKALWQSRRDEGLHLQAFALSGTPSHGASMTCKSLFLFSSISHLNYAKVKLNFVSPSFI